MIGHLVQQSCKNGTASFFSTIRQQSFLRRGNRLHKLRERGISFATDVGASSSLSPGSGNPRSLSFFNAQVVVHIEAFDWEGSSVSRVINSLTKLVVNAMPLIDELLADFEAVMWMCSLDNASGYWAIPLTQRARLITAFICPLGHFEWTRMPQGLKNAP